MKGAINITPVRAETVKNAEMMYVVALPGPLGLQA